MSDLSHLLNVLLDLVFACGAGIACIVGWRWIARLSQPVGIVVGLGILVRAWAGLGLFVISYYDLPMFASLHTADGFWTLAPDAEVYFELAASAAEGATIPAGSPSPAFVRLLGWWLRATGVVPASAVLFNLTLYVASCFLLVVAFRPVKSLVAKRAALITVGALSFSPVMILLGTQSLKDVFSVFLIITAAVGMAALLTGRDVSRFHWITALQILSIAMAIYLMAGLRAYYALFIWSAAAVALIVRAIALPRPLALRWSALSCGVLAVFWLAFMTGAGPYYASYANLITRTVGVRIPLIAPAAEPVALSDSPEESGMGVAVSRVDFLRRGFVNTKGATNLTSSSQDAAALQALVVGLAAMFIPISGLMQLSIVEFSGGRGFLLITDLDTLFMDLALLAVGWLLVTTGRPTRGQLPFTCFTLALGLVSAVLMAYIVTNYGTLFRLRLLATVPLWLAPLALARMSTGVPLAGGLEVDAGWTSPHVSEGRELAVQTRGHL